LNWLDDAVTLIVFNNSKSTGSVWQPHETCFIIRRGHDWKFIFSSLLCGPAYYNSMHTSVGSNLEMCVKGDNVSATLFHMHIAVRCHSPELLVKLHDNHATTSLLRKNPVKLEFTACAWSCFQSITYGGWHWRI